MTIGRERELAEVRRLLGTTRLLTLAGTGGCGKTRLAYQLATGLVDDYPDGVWAIDLAPLADPALVPQTVASVLGLREAAGQPILTTLETYLRPRHLLLVLDNCEHLVEACARLAEHLLQSCPSLKILATSREALGVPGELVWRVPPLALPDPKHLPPAGRALASELVGVEAVRLFAERAALAVPSFSLTDQDALVVARICWQLDGLPLAIELAAAWVRLLSVEQIQGRLGDRLALLTGGYRTDQPRHQTLRAAVDWSHDLLSEQERALWRRLAVFAGGFVLEAAEAVCPGEEVEEHEVLWLLRRLVDKSLVQVEAREGQARYRLLETIREYAWERLVEGGEEEALRRRHRDWCLTLAERAEPELFGASQTAWLDQLEVELANFRAALGWCLERDLDAGLRLAVALSRFWDVRGRRTEGLRWLRGMLARATEPTSLRAWALCHAGRMASLQESDAAASALLKDSLALFRKLEDRRGVGWTLLRLGFVTRYDRERSLPLTEEALATFREIGDPRGIASALHQLGVDVGHAGDHTRAMMLLRESLSLQRSIGDLPDPFGFNRLGVLSQHAGEHEQARALLEEGLSISRQIGDQEGIAFALGDLGNLALCLGDYRQAKTLIQESLSIERSAGNKLGIMWRLLELGKLASIEGDPDGARRLLDESLVLSRELGATQVRGLILASLGNVARLAGRLDEAGQLVKDGLTAGSIADRGPTISEYFWLSGVIASQLGTHARAVRLIGAAFAHGPERTLFTPVDQSDCDLALAAARMTLGEEGFSRAWAEGQAMSLDEAVEYALVETG